MPLEHLSEDQRDCLQEISNVATGHAANNLAWELGCFVTLPIPLIRILEAEKISTSLDCLQADLGRYAASQHFSNQYKLAAEQESPAVLSGLAMVVLSEKCSPGENKRDLGATSEQRVINSCRPMAQIWLDALSDHMRWGIQCQEPKLLDHRSLDTITNSATVNWSCVLTVEINYTIETHGMNCDLLFMFPDSAIDRVAAYMDELLNLL